MFMKKQPAVEKVKPFFNLIWDGRATMKQLTVFEDFKSYLNDDFKKLIKLDRPPEVHVVRPDNSTRSMVLSPGASGEYSGVFSDTPLVGPYLFSTEVTATSPGGIASRASGSLQV